MDDLRIIPPEELEKEKLFDQAVKALEAELKLKRIEYDLTLNHNPPFIFTNGDQFEPQVKDRVFALFHKFFGK